MNKYLYFYNYSPNEQALCEMEFRHIFHENMSSKYYLTNQCFDYTRSVFIKGRLDIMKSSDCFDDIIHFIEDSQMCYYDFKVIYLKNEITHIDYQESLQRCRDIAFPIDGSVNMQEPQIIFAITKINADWHFGIYHNQTVWSQNYEKPHSYSHSLNIRDARTLVNIAVGNDMKLKVVDPCCGIGTVVLEALSMGIDIEGFDINRDVAYQARLNLEHFGYDSHIIQRKDMRTLTKKYDVTILDIPYGVYSPFTYQQQLSLLEGTLKLAPTLVLVSHIDMNEDLENLGYQIVDQTTIQKGNFLRYMTKAIQKQKISI